MKFSDLFLYFSWARKMGTPVYTLRILRFYDVVITLLIHAWPAGLPLRQRLGEGASEIYIARLIRGAEELVSFSF